MPAISFIHPHTLLIPQPQPHSLSPPHSHSHSLTQLQWARTLSAPPSSRAPLGAVAARAGLGAVVARARARALPTRSRPLAARPCPSSAVATRRARACGLSSAHRAAPRSVASAPTAVCASRTCSSTTSRSTPSVARRVASAVSVLVDCGQPNTASIAHYLDCLFFSVSQ